MNLWTTYLIQRLPLGNTDPADVDDLVRSGLRVLEVLVGVGEQVRTHSNLFLKSGFTR